MKRTIVIHTGFKTYLLGFFIILILVSLITPSLFDTIIDALNRLSGVLK